MQKLKPISRAMRGVVLGVALLALLGSGYGAWRYFDQPPLDRYSPLIAQMAAHKVDPDYQGRIMLDKSFPGLVPKDMVYITWRDDGSFAAMFPTYYGEGSEIAGLVYTSRPLTDDDTTQRTTSAINFAERLISVGSYKYLILEKKINPNWYHVSYKLH